MDSPEQEPVRGEADLPEPAAPPIPSDAAPASAAPAASAASPAADAASSPPPGDPPVDWPARLRASPLPPALRESLARCVERVEPPLPDDREPRIPLGEVARLLGEVVPAMAFTAPPTLGGHPRGESFFSSQPDDGQPTDEQSRQWALEQIARAGFARKTTTT